MFAFGCWAGIKMFLHEKGACQNDMKTVSLQFYGFSKWTGKERFVLLHGPVPECLRLVHGKELPVPKGWSSRLPTWEPQVTIARNCRFPQVRSHGSQPGNQRLPLQGIAGSQKLEFMFSKLSGFHCTELQVPKAWNSWFQAWKSNVTSGKICWLQKVRTHGS